jgi:hypothetical protein
MLMPDVCLTYAFRMLTFADVCRFDKSNNAQIEYKEFAAVLTLLPLLVQKYKY